MPSHPTFLINGRPVDHPDRRFQEIDGPTGKVVGNFPEATVEDANAAVEAAVAAFAGEWPHLSAAKRQALFDRLLAVLVDEFGYERDGLPCRVVAFYRDLLGASYGEVLVNTERYSNYTVREPLGVVAVFVPVNSPALTGLTGCIPALAAGNTVVLKVPHLKVQEGLNLGHAMHRAGFPAGVINVIAGTTVTPSEAIVADPRVRMVSFTGSAATAKKIMAACAPGLKRLHLNLGNKGPALIFADSDWPAALEALVPRMFPGQACSAPSRLLLEESIADAAIAKLRALARAKGPVPLIDHASCRRLERYVALGRTEGEVLFGGNPHVPPQHPNGSWYEPTAIRFRDQRSAVCRDEIFGPLVSVLTFKDEDEAVALANDTEFGLIAFAFTADARRRQRLARRLQFGTVALNGVHELSPHSPWGGFKQSGVGKHYGAHALDNFTEVKSVQVVHA